jgi:aminoglycoside 6'-N-acetyltransferase I
MRIRPVRDDDTAEWLRMSQALDPSCPREEHEADLRLIRARSDAEVFVIERPEGGLAGYVEIASRSYADGCATSPVGYVEAWYVDADVRRSGLGRALLTAAEDWARRQGYAEIASDALLENDVSLHAHLGSGYRVVDRVVQFRKPLDDAVERPRQVGDSLGNHSASERPMAADSSA